MVSKAPRRETLPLSGAVAATHSEKSRAPFSSKADRQEFFLPVVGFVWFYPEEVAVINHPSFQRLARINQLGQAHLVFRGATHKRIEHVLGAVGIAQRMIAAVLFNAEKSRAKGLTGFSAPLSIQEQRFIRLGALLHDIGHLAAGHTLEDELELVGKHDADARLNLILNKRDWVDNSGEGVDSLRQVIDGEYDKYIPEGLIGHIAPSELLHMLIRKPPTGQDNLGKKQLRLLGSDEIRFHVCTNMIGNTICADLLDYIYRDWYHVGRPRSSEDRIFQYMEVRREGLADPRPRPHPDDRFVMALGQKRRIRTDGVSAILGLLEWRYELAETVLFHRTKLAAAAMLDRALYELWFDLEPEKLVERLLPLSDDELIDEAIRDATAPGESEEDLHKRQRRNVALKILKLLRDRVLFKELDTFDVTNLPSGYIGHIKRTYTGPEDNKRQGAKNRSSAARLIENSYGLPAGSIAIYCSNIKAKIAEVSISVDGEILPFNKFERKYDNRLSGGHLDAQERRFDRLWRIYFFIESEVKSALTDERLLLLQQTIKDVVLPIEGNAELVQKAKEKALAYVHQERTAGNNGIEFVEVAEFARSDAFSGGAGATQLETFPNGAPSIKSFVRQRKA